ncbi:MAG: hypothetical protein V1821_04525 [bacterium]
MTAETYRGLETEERDRRTIQTIIEENSDQLRRVAGSFSFFNRRLKLVDLFLKALKLETLKTEASNKGAKLTEAENQSLVQTKSEIASSENAPHFDRSFFFTLNSHSESELKDLRDKITKEIASLVQQSQVLLGEYAQREQELRRAVRDANTDAEKLDILKRAGYTDPEITLNRYRSSESYDNKLEARAGRLLGAQVENEARIEQVLREGKERFDSINNALVALVDELSLLDKEQDEIDARIRFEAQKLDRIARTPDFLAEIRQAGGPKTADLQTALILYSKAIAEDSGFWHRGTEVLIALLDLKKSAESIKESAGFLQFKNKKAVDALLQSIEWAQRDIANLVIAEDDRQTVLDKKDELYDEKMEKIAAQLIALVSDCEQNAGEPFKPEDFWRQDTLAHTIYKQASRGILVEGYRAPEHYHETKIAEALRGKIDKLLNTSDFARATNALREMVQ